MDRQPAAVRVQHRPGADRRRRAHAVSRLGPAARPARPGPVAAQPAGRDRRRRVVEQPLRPGRRRSPATRSRRTTPICLSSGRRARGCRSRSRRRKCGRRRSRNCGYRTRSTPARCTGSSRPSPGRTSRAGRTGRRSPCPSPGLRTTPTRTNPARSKTGFAWPIAVSVSIHGTGHVSHASRTKPAAIPAPR